MQTDGWLKSSAIVAASPHPFGFEGCAALYCPGPGLSCFLQQHPSTRQIVALLLRERQCSLCLVWPGLAGIVGGGEGHLLKTSGPPCHDDHRSPSPSAEWHNAGPRT